MTGHVIFLNGTSSSGKSSIAAELLELLPGPYFSLSRDAVNSMRSRTRTPEFGTPEFDVVFDRTVLGYHRMLAGLAAAGNGRTGSPTVWKCCGSRKLLSWGCTVRCPSCSVASGRGVIDRRGWPSGSSRWCMRTAITISSATHRFSAQANARGRSRNSSPNQTVRVRFGGWHG